MIDQNYKCSTSDCSADLILDLADLADGTYPADAACLALSDEPIPGPRLSSVYHHLYDCRPCLKLYIRELKSRLESIECGGEFLNACCLLHEKKQMSAWAAENFDGDYVC